MDVVLGCVASSVVNSVIEGGIVPTCNVKTAGLSDELVGSVVIFVAFVVVLGSIIVTLSSRISGSFDEI